MRAGAGLDGDLPGRAVEVAGRPVPVLPFAAIHRELDDVPVGAVERLVLVQEGLDAVLAGRDEPEALERVSECLLVDHGLLTGRQALDVDAEDLLGPGILGDLESRFAVLLGGEHHQQPAVERLVAQLGPEADRDAGRGFRRDRRWAEASAAGVAARSPRQQIPHATSNHRIGRTRRLVFMVGRPAVGCSRGSELPASAGSTSRPSGRDEAADARPPVRRVRSTILPVPAAQCQGLAVRTADHSRRALRRGSPRARRRAARTGGSAG